MTDIGGFMKRDSVKKWEQKQRLLKYRREAVKQSKERIKLDKLNRKAEKLSLCLIEQATKYELILKSELRKRGIKARFQYPIVVPPYNYYCIDFYFSKWKLGVETDGHHHYTNKGLKNDYIRSKRLNTLGITIIRFENSQIENDIDFVVKRILLKINEL